MGYAFYSDESGISKNDKCYTIGAILIPNHLINEFHHFLQNIVKKHKIKSEVKWEKISTSYNMMNFAIDLLKELQNGPYIFTCIVVLKSAYLKWHVNKEEAFYTTYTLLLEHCTRGLEEAVTAEIDNRNDLYPKQHEVVEVISNHKLKESIGKVVSVTKEDSKNNLELQAADILTGAVNASHNLYLNPDAQIHAGKILLLNRLSRILGWTELHYDTYPNTVFNIWHFPEKEYRAIPSTKNIITNLEIPNISLDDLKSNNI